MSLSDLAVYVSSILNNLNSHSYQCDIKIKVYREFFFSNMVKTKIRFNCQTLVTY